MKKIYRIIFLITVLIFSSTYTPSQIGLTEDKKQLFFEVKKIIILNNYLIDKKEIKKKLNKIYKKNIFSIKRKEIADPLLDIDFLKKIEVKKRYPNTIIIKIYETEPVAILFKNKDKYLLDSSANLIRYQDSMSSYNLPNIFGEDAEYNFLNFLKKLKNSNFPKDKVENFFYYKIGRWDLQLMDKRTIKLPHNKMEDGIKKSIELLNREDFKIYNVIDLRVSGKIIVE